MNTLNFKSTHLKGLLGELEFTLHFLKMGWNVYKPIDNNCRADLVIEKNGKYKKIQIKYCTPYKGCLRIDLEHSRKTTKPYCIEEVDDIALYDSTNYNFYLIPLTDILPRKEMWLRVAKISKNQSKNINWQINI